jgi:nucleoside-diphosphate-sugar epimerase
MLVHAPCRLGEKINEASPIEGRWEYPLSKIKAEEVIRKKRGKIPAVILRIAGVYDHYGHSIPLSQQIGRIWNKIFESHLFQEI